MELGGTQNQLVGLGASWEGLGASWEGLGASWESHEARWGGGKKENGAFPVYGGTIGYRPLRGCCPKTYTHIFLSSFPLTCTITHLIGKNGSSSDPDIR